MAETTTEHPIFTKKINTRMKQFFGSIATTIAACLLMNIAPVHAQTATTDHVQVTLEFVDVMSLTVNGSQTEVILRYETMEDYLEGVESRQDKHLSVFSINPFQVKVAAQGSNQFGSSLIETESVQVEAVGFNDVSGIFDQNVVQVGVAAQPIFKSNHFSNGGTIDINYSTKGSPGLKGQSVGAHAGQSYTKTFIYSIETL